MKSTTLKSTNVSHKTRNWLAILLILILGFVLRMYQFNAPISDSDSNEQSKILMVTKNIAETGKFTGRYEKTRLEQNLIASDTLEYNPSRLLLFESGTLLISNITRLPLHQSARLINILAFLLLIAVMYLMTLRYQPFQTALFVALALCLSPYAILQSRQVGIHILPLTLMMISIYLSFLLTPRSKNEFRTILCFMFSLLFASVAIASNPLYAVFLLPISYLLYKRSGLDLLRGVYFYIFMLGAIVPTIFINIYQNTLPSLFPLPIWSSQVDYLSTSKQMLFLNRHFIETILLNRLINTILGGFGLGFVIIGLFRRDAKFHLFHFLTVSALLSLALFPEGYLNTMSLGVMFLVPFTYYLASGINMLFTARQNFTSGVVSMLIILLFLGLSTYLSWGQVGPLYATDSNKVLITKMISTLTYPSDRIATDTKGDPTLLYLSGRDGIPTTDNGDEELVTNGISYLVTSNPGYAKDLSEKYQSVFSTDNAFIFSLK